MENAFAAGNLTAEPGKSYAYDAENRMVSSTVSSVTTTYAYDGDGKRVRKGTAKLYWYGTSADVLSESDAAGTIGDEFVFFGGKRIARRDSSSAVFYYVADHLGSSRVITQANGAVCFDADYLPFGEERVYTNTCPTPYKFTGKERDAESGLDFFIARYYSSGYGRFLSPDDFWNDSELADPQRWNLYSFTRNNPITLVDIWGEDVTYGSEQLRVLVTQFRVASKTFDDALKGYEGKGAPDLHFRFGSARCDTFGHCGGNFTMSTEGLIATGQGWQFAYYAGGTITIDPSLLPEDEEKLDVLGHEVGHADDARKNPSRLHTDSQVPPSKTAEGYRRRPEERRAEAFKARVDRERAKSKEKSGANPTTNRQTPPTKPTGPAVPDQKKPPKLSPPPKKPKPEHKP